MQLRFVPLLATTIACSSEPRCERIGSLEPATDVQIAIRGAGADRPVVIHDREGVIVNELVTDANGVVQIATVPAEATVTVDLGEFEDFPFFNRRAILVTYFGLASGDSLVLGRAHRPPRPVGSAVVTLRFTEPTDVAISGYDVSLGSNCAALLPIDSLGVGEIREVALETDCLFDPGVVALMALDATDRHVVAGASAPFSVASGGTTTVDLGGWQVASDAVLTISGNSRDGDFVGDTYSEFTGYVGNEPDIRFGDQRTLPAPSTFHLPFVPSVFDRVGISASRDGRDEEFRTVLSRPVDLAIEDWLPAIGGFELVDHGDGAPTLSWGHDYLEQVAVARYSADTDGPGIQRYAVRHDQGCSCALPPLPSSYAVRFPGFLDNVRIDASVFLYQTPDLGAGELLRVFDPLGSNLPDDVGVYSASIFESFTRNPRPDSE